MLSPLVMQQYNSSYIGNELVEQQEKSTSNLLLQRIMQIRIYTYSGTSTLLSRKVVFSRRFKMY